MTSPCPCYSVPARGVLTAVSHTAGTCQTTIDSPFDDGPVGSALLVALATDPLQADLYNAAVAQYYKMIGPLKSSIHNNKKTALAHVYAGYILAIASNAVVVADLTALLKIATCGLLEAKAFDGPCGDLLVSWGTMIEGFFLSLVENVNESAVTKVALVAVMKSSADAHKCCKLEPFTGFLNATITPIVQ